MRVIAEKEPIEEVTKKEYEEMKSKLKNRKAPDTQGWTYELIKNAGTDLDKSILTAINCLLNEFEVVSEWNEMMIKAVDKTKGWLEMKQKRGLFMTNIISKCVERILFKRREIELIEGMSRFQTGGVIKRGTQDNLFIINYIIDTYKQQNKDLYILFADIEKCFDNLWLRDCIVELSRCRIPIQEAYYIYKMNKEVNARVITPVGITEAIKLEEIVRQGTVGGNKLCGKSVDRINEMEENIIIDNDEIKYPTFVDDTIGAGEISKLEGMNRKMRTLETTKKYRYNNKKGKTEWMKIKNSRKKQEREEEVDLEVSAGKIGQTDKYKYLGDVYSEKGDNESKIEANGEKIEGMIRDIIRESNTGKIGGATLTVRKMLISVIATPTLLTNTETWYNITQHEQQLITKQHHQILTRCLEIPRSTPYYGLISEMNIIPYVDNIWYVVSWFRGFSRCP